MAEGILFCAATPSTDGAAAYHGWQECVDSASWHAQSEVGLGHQFELANGWGGPRFAVRFDISNPEAVFNEPEFRRWYMSSNLGSADVDATYEDTARFAGRLVARSGQSWDPTANVLAYVLTFAVPEEFWDEFERWYAEEHAPILLKEPRWLGCERYLAIDAVDEFSPMMGSAEPAAARPTHLVVHLLEDAEALDSPARMAARSTEWRARLAENVWHRDSVRWLYRPLGSRN